VHARVSNSATGVARFQRGRATSLSCRSAPLRTSPPCTTAAVLGGTANRPARRGKRIGVASGQETGAYFRDLIFSKSTPVQCEALYVFGEISPSPHHRGDHAVRGRFQDNGCDEPLVERVLIHPRGKAEDPEPPRPCNAEDEAFIHEEGSAPANPQRPFDDSEVATGQCGQGLNRCSCCRSTSSLPRSSR
jgi:hypothetical protein